jgi:hypothetical protein
VPSGDDSVCVNTSGNAVLAYHSYFDRIRVRQPNTS